MRSRRVPLLLLAATLVCGCRSSHPQAPDLVLLNAKIWTGDAARPEATAIAIRAGRILTVGSSDAVATMATDGTRVIDLAGRRVVPGFNDAH